MEGKGIAESGDGYLSLRSEIFTVPRDKDGHFNFWLKRDFPANVAFEWEFRYSEPGDQGLALIIWAAKGRNGEDIFDPSLPSRRGEVMTDFTKGAINCYHTSYIARGRKTANLRKNYGFHVLTNGHGLSTISNPDEWHVVRLEQYNGIIRLLFDGKESKNPTGMLMMALSEVPQSALAGNLHSGSKITCIAATIETFGCINLKIYNWLFRHFKE